MKILYLMHVSWGWIKQRPHFFAEKLSQEYEITVKYFDSLRTKHKANKKNSKLKSSPIYLPLRNSLFASKQINRKIFQWIFKAQIGKVSQYSHVWICNILLYKYIKDYLSDNQVVIYDCMDDDFEFPNIKSNPTLASELKSLERELVNRSDVILCSSKYLAKKVSSRTKTDISKFNIVYNGIELKNDRNSNSLDKKTEEIIRSIDSYTNPIIYIGTIAEWFNFELIIKMLNDNNDIHVILFGPTEINIPKHPRLIYKGAVPREAIFKIMEKAKALIMPFIVNELIRSVNPVKLYEYIASNKPVVAPYYEELDQFLPYIYTYGTDDEFLNLVSLLASDKLNVKQDKGSCLNFVKSNTWNGRASQVKALLK